jgi:hypothetical protein
MPVIELISGRIICASEPTITEEGRIVAEYRTPYDSDVKYHFRGIVPEDVEKYKIREWAFENLNGSFVIKADLIDKGFSHVSTARTYGIYLSREDDLMAWKIMWS